MDISMHRMYTEHTSYQAIIAASSFIDHMNVLTAGLPPHMRLVEPVLTPRFVPTCSDALLQGLGELATCTGVRIQSHLAEARDQVDCVRIIYWANVRSKRIALSGRRPNWRTYPHTGRLSHIARSPTLTFQPGLCICAKRCAMACMLGSGVSRMREGVRSESARVPSGIADNDTEATAVGNNDVPHIVFGFGQRDCPGRCLTLDRLWITIASVLSVYTVSKPKDANGAVIEPEIEFTNGIVSRPKMFKCSVVPRLEAALALIKQTEDERDMAK
ncbi:hypothetical protein EW146_g260 [Bondarzewia mesenterica]|uniref:Cytochrome P450 n=1 Tax=Bondarzewia mesenterica TaxID=1095465 RepID=A0A4S4M845_9AGAM|nr:hypothetical protein EW146_g260 [Bondarzewia mesenterica]